MCGIYPKLYIPILCKDRWHHVVKSSLCIITVKVHIAIEEEDRNQENPFSLLKTHQKCQINRPICLRGDLGSPALEVEFDPLVDSALLYAVDLIHIYCFVSSLASFLSSFSSFAILPFRDLPLSLLGPCPRHRRCRFESNSIDSVSIIGWVCRTVSGNLAIMPCKRIF